MARKQGGKGGASPTPHGVIKGYPTQGSYKPGSGAGKITKRLQKYAAELSSFHKEPRYD